MVDMPTFPYLIVILLLFLKSVNPYRDGLGIFFLSFVWIFIPAPESPPESIDSAYTGDSGALDVPLLRRRTAAGASGKRYIIRKEYFTARVIHRKTVPESVSQPVPQRVLKGPDIAVRALLTRIS